MKIIDFLGGNPDNIVHNGRLHLLPTKWSIDFGEPIDLEGHGPENADDPILVNRISEEARSTIQRMVDGRLARRRSIWFG